MPTSRESGNPELQIIYIICVIHFSRLVKINAPLVKVNRSKSRSTHVRAKIFCKSRACKEVWFNAASTIE